MGILLIIISCFVDWWSHLIDHRYSDTKVKNIYIYIYIVPANSLQFSFMNVQLISLYYKTLRKYKLLQYKKQSQPLLSSTSQTYQLNINRFRNISLSLLLFSTYFLIFMLKPFLDKWDARREYLILNNDPMFYLR